MKRRVLIWVLLLSLIVAMLPMAAAAAGTPTFSASSVSGCVGSTVEVSFTIKNNTGIVGAELKGSYDTSKLEFVSAANGDVMSSPLCNTKDGSIYYSWDDSLTSGITDDGIMCTLTFKILEGCAPGDKIDIQITSFKAHDTNLDDVNFQTSGGSVSVTSHSWGASAYTWSADNSTCTAKRSQTCGCGGTETETATASKKEETTQTIYTVSFQNPAFASQTKKVAAGPIKVTFRLIGATQSEKGVDLSKGSSDSEYVTWITTKTYSIDAGSTVYDLIKKALDAAGLDHEMSANYLVSVDAPSVLGGYSLGEFDNGSRSGWMFTVNGKHGSLGIGEQKLVNGDAVIVHYVNDYLYEESKFPWLNAPDTEPTKPEDPAPTEPTPTEPNNPTTEPSAPQDPTTQPTNPSESTAPTVSTDPSESTAPSEPTEPAGSKEPTGDSKECGCWCCRWWWLIFLCGIPVNALIIWGTPRLVSKLKELRNREKVSEDTTEIPVDIDKESKE